jgi:Regulator of chromosome condensation (RCC1) repeat/IPT/TIG domain
MGMSALDHAEGSCRRRAGLIMSLAAVLVIGVSVSAWAKPVGQVMAWGEGAKDRPKPVADLGGVTAASVGARGSVALLSDGTVMAWGLNLEGQLGNGSSAENSAVPVVVDGLDGVTAVSTSGYNSMALLSNGHVMTWGSNLAGVLGIGTTTGPEYCDEGNTCSRTPVEVGGLSGVTAISAGGFFDLALLSDGTVMAWGGGGSGDLGDGSEAGSDVPIPVSGLSGVTAISAGATHSLALLSNGTVMSWGERSYGELGNETSGDEPALVCATGAVGPCPFGPYLTDVTAVSSASGGVHSLALLSNGTAVAWGSNKDGQLGNGETGPDTCGLRSEPIGCAQAPVAVSALSGVTAVSAGGAHSLALLGNGTVMAWGDGEHGQLGNGKRNNVNVPTPVNGLSGIEGISAGGQYSLAFESPAPTVTKVSPKTGSAEGRLIVTLSGTNFTAATTVKFGLTNAESFTVNSPTSITAVSPAESPGKVDVTVTTPVGTSAISSKDHFKFT